MDDQGFKDEERLCNTGVRVSNACVTAVDIARPEMAVSSTSASSLFWCQNASLQLRLRYTGSEPASLVAL